MSAALDGELLATIISNDAAVALAAKARTGISIFSATARTLLRNGEDFCALGGFDQIVTDARSCRKLFYVFGDNVSQLHHMPIQFRVFGNVALNATAIGL